AERRCFVRFRPAHLRTSAMMGKILETQPEAIPVCADDVAKSLKLLRFAIGGKTHHFVLVTKFQETQILRDRAVEQPQGMRKRNRAFYLHAASGAASPHGAGEIAQSVRGKQRRPFERRNKKRAREMRLMVFDAMKLRGNTFRRGLECMCQCFGYPCELHQNFRSFASERRHA